MIMVPFKIFIHCLPHQTFGTLLSLPLHLSLTLSLSLSLSHAFFVGATLMNQTSSRSHSIFTIVIECAENSKEKGDHIRVGKLNLVDLAGSERQSKVREEDHIRLK